MPPSLLKGVIWAFIKEAFFNRKTLPGFAHRNKLAALLAITNTLLFFMLLFMSEQAFQHQGKSLALKQRIELLDRQNKQLVRSDTDLQSCRTQMDFIQEDYRKVSHSLSMCIATQTARPARPEDGTPPKPNNRPKPPPVIPPRTYTDDSLKRKLDAIRD